MEDLPCPKQLLLRDGVPIVRRTLNQVRYVNKKIGYIHHPVIVGLKSKFSDVGQSVEELENPGNCVLKAVHELSFVSSLFLLGDVVFTDEAIESILLDDKELQFYGSPDLSPSTGELFAYKVMGNDALREARRLIEKVPCWANVEPGHQSGHLRDLLWQYDDMSLLTVIDDGTDDVDTYEDIKKLRLEIPCSADH